MSMRSAVSIWQHAGQDPACPVNLRPPTDTSRAAFEVAHAYRVWALLRSETVCQRKPCAPGFITERAGFICLVSRLGAL